MTSEIQETAGIIDKIQKGKRISATPSRELVNGADVR